MLVAYGLVVCWSAVQGDADYNFTRQLQGVAVGLVAMVALWAFDYRRLSNLTTALLVINVVLILLPHIPGLGTDAGMGAKSWIKIGMQVQPGEFAKVTVVLFAASLLARYQGTLDDWREYCKVLGMLLVPFAAHHDPAGFGHGSGVPGHLGGGARHGRRQGALPAHHAYRRHRGHRGRVRRRRAAEVPAVRRHVGVPPLEELPAQPPARVPEPRGRPLRRRLQPRPGQDCHRQRWPVRQGIGNATQSTHGFLPEAPTDFIFCVLAEEFGFVGVMALIGLYALLIVACLSIARRADNLFGMLIVMGVVGMWLFQILENIGMDCGLMPITGIPLPFVSYGSSFMS